MGNIALAAAPPAPAVEVTVRLNSESTSAEVLVWCPRDRPGLLSALMFILAQADLEIQSARALSDDRGGGVLDTFRVTSPYDLVSRVALAKSSIEHALATPPSFFPARTAAWAQPSPPDSASAPSETSCFVARASEGRQTVLSLWCPDRPMVHADVAALLARRSLDVLSAKIVKHRIDGSVAATFVVRQSLLAEPRAGGGAGAAEDPPRQLSECEWDEVEAQIRATAAHAALRPRRPPEGQVTLCFPAVAGLDALRAVLPHAVLEDVLAKQAFPLPFGAFQHYLSRRLF